MNPKLTKCISLSTETRNYFADSEDFKNLNLIMNKCGEYVQELSKISLKTKMLFDLCKILQNRRNFPNLRHLQVNVFDSVVTGQGVAEPCVPLPQRKRLTSLNLQTIGQGTTYQNNFQSLINSAVDLERLSLTGNWLPSLDNKWNLTFFKFTGGGNWDMTKISQILNRVANSLTYLHLGNIPPWNHGTHESIFLTLPVMPNLQKLVILDLPAFRLHFDDFSRQRLKQLRSLELGNLVEESLQAMACRDAISDIINPRVTMLNVRGRVSSKLKTHFKNQFPNVQCSK